MITEKKKKKKRENLKFKKMTINLKSTEDNI